MAYTYVQEGKGDRGAWFRMQEYRSIEDFDTLCQNKERLRVAVGEERAKEIEADPMLFVDAEKFRKFHAKARFRSVATTALVLAGGSTIAAP